MTSPNPSYTAPVGTVVSYVSIPIANLERALDFYRETLGFGVSDESSARAALLSPGGDIHHLGLTPVADGSRKAGAARIGIRFPRRSALARALRRITDRGLRPEAARRLGTRELVLLRDPEGNQIELFWERPHTASTLPAVEGEFEDHPLDLAELLQAAEDPERAESGGLVETGGRVDATTLAQIREQARIDEGVQETFPASDPVSVAIDPMEPPNSDEARAARRRPQG